MYKTGVNFNKSKLNDTNKTKSKEKEAIKDNE